ncbi:hypothetical protein FQA39_LY01545 [Lamprigera yunnana]|nr:hypothetical protein FQA39_LY01545 [Lamprigera yunnana]
MPPTTEPTITPEKTYLLGTKECTYGPSFWCKNLTTSAGCRATKHCIQTVWLHQQLAPDTSSICDTCLQMVKEARDQLLSNETQEEIKEVFEGSCNLIPIKIIAKECCKIIDEFSLELIDVLASQMNPQMVCSVAGLCNSERVHELLAESTNDVVSKASVKKPSTCEGCYTVVNRVVNNFQSSSRDQVLQSFLQICGKMGSLSDACSNIILTYFNEIYSHLTENLTPNEFCLMSGECSAMFHEHVNVEVTPLSRTGIVPIGNEDLPCELCEQLVHHLRDILVANTTETEFHQVLIGICKQTKSFKDECINIVEQYYPMIYHFLVHELNGTVLCSLAGICPKPGLYDDKAHLIPLLPLETVENMHKALQPAPLDPKLMQLPIERVMPPSLTVIGNTELCTFCQYFLHFVQQVITEPATEEKIKQVVDEACKALPSSISPMCEDFVNTYGPAFIALFAQEIDPSTICPKLSLCPSNDMHKIENVEVFMNQNKRNKPNCPLCLFAITSLKELIDDKKTEESIKRGLQSLCSHFKGNLATECSEFVKTYSEQIIDLLIKDLSPQDVCAALKLCDIENQVTVKIPYGGEIETNQIFDDTAEGKAIAPVETVNQDVCLICEFLMSELQNVLKNNATEEEIREQLHKICNAFSSKYLKDHCNSFIDQYEEMVIQLLINSLSPRDVCITLRLCTKVENEALEVHDLMRQPNESELDDDLSIKSPQCSLCKLVLRQLEKILDGKISEDAVINALEKVCNLFPSEKERCDKFVEQYGKQIVEFIKFVSTPEEICSILTLCEVHQFKLEIRKCAVCEVAVDIMHTILQNPNVDKALEHVLEKTCRAFPPKNQELCRTMVQVYGEKIFYMLGTSLKPVEICQEIRLCGSQMYRPGEVMLGRNKCTRGPGYWCISQATATECSEEIVDVFESSCKFIPLKIIAKGCSKIADKFSPELIDALASQMDPQVVCSIAGLCNCEHVRVLLAQSRHDVVSKTNIKKSTACEGCYTVVNFVVNKLRSSSQNEFLKTFLQICGKMENLSDTCSNITLTHYKGIYSYLTENLNPNEFCLMSRKCSAMFHEHVNSRTGVVPIESANLPCELCKQVMYHLRNILVVNSTEFEFQQVLLGICKRMKYSLAIIECTDIVERYYPMIYHFLVHELNSTVLCSLADLCPGSAIKVNDKAFLVPTETVDSMRQVSQPASIDPKLVQFPIELIALATIGYSDIGVCVFCEYFIDYVNSVITEPVTEEKVKEIVDGTSCDVLPGFLSALCERFVGEYGTAFIKAYAGKTDSSKICSILNVCPSRTHEIQNSPAFVNQNNRSNLSCSLCLFAITSLEKVDNNKTAEESIKKGLEYLCSDFKRNSTTKCHGFVETYRDQIIELVIKDIPSEDVCAALKLCDADNQRTVKMQYGDPIETNQIYDDTAEGKTILPVESHNEEVCLVCELLINGFLNVLKSNVAEEVMHKICNTFSSKSLRDHCDTFIDKYVDRVIHLFFDNLSSLDVCIALNLCKNTENKASELRNLTIGSTKPDTIAEPSIKSPQCWLCKLIMKQLEILLNKRISEVSPIGRYEGLTAKEAKGRARQREIRTRVEWRGLNPIGHPGFLFKASGSYPTKYACLDVAKGSGFYRTRRRTDPKRRQRKSIIDALAKVCNFFPLKKEKCGRFVEYYGEKIIKFLKFVTTPEELCSILILCDIGQFKFEISNCTVCEVTVDIMGTILQNPKVDKTLEGVLEKTCQAFPLKIQEMCRMVVEINGEEIFYRLGSSLRPGEICKAVRLCGSAINEPGTATVMSQNSAEKSYGNSNDLIK